MSKESLKKDWIELINVDLPRIPPITEKTKQLNKRFSSWFHGSVRLALQKYKTDEEYESWCKKLLDTPLL